MAFRSIGSLGGSRRSSFSFSFPAPPSFSWGDAPTSRKKDDPGGFFGFIDNLADDVKDTVTGIPKGVEMFIREPTKSLEAIGHSYSAMYGPLFRGDFGRFGKNLYEHPLGPILDGIALATAPFTAGGTLAARSGSILGRVGSRVGSEGVARAGFALRDFGHHVRRSDSLNIPAPGARGAAPIEDALGNPLNYAIKPSSTRPTQRMLQKAMNQLMVRLPDNAPVVGNTARFGRLKDRALRYEAMAHAGKARGFMRKFHKLNDPERAAFSLLARGVHPSVYKKYLEGNAEHIGDLVSPGMRKALDNPKTKTLFENPTPKLLDALDEGRRLADEDAALKIKYGWLSPEEALDAPFQWIRMIEGAKYLDARQIAARSRKLDKKLARLEKDDARLVKRMSRLKQGTPAIRATQREADKLARESSGAARRRERLRREADQLETTKRELEFLKEDLDNLMTGAGIPDDVTTRLERGGNAAFDATVRSGVRVGKDLEKARLKALGKTYDRVINLQAKYERQAAAYLGLQHQLQKAALIVERQSENFDNVLAARRERVELLRLERDKLDEIRDTRADLVRERKEVAAMQPGIHGGRGREEILADIEAGRGIEPFYLPDTAVPKRVNIVSKAGGGKSSPRSPVFVNKGVRMRMGLIALQPDVLSPEFFTTVKTALHSDIHATLVGAGQRLPVGQPLPKGMVFIRRHKSEKIGPTERERHIHEELMENLVEPDGIRDNLVSRVEGEAVNGYRLIVPEKLVKKLAGEYRRSTKFMDLVFHKPTTLWRKIILGLRPAFFVNNFVGNHFLYALSYAGFDGLRAYVNAVKTSRGSGAALRMIRDGSTPDDMREALMLEFFPDQIHGTFGETQFPATMGRTRKKVERVSLGIMPATQRIAEGMLRRAAVETQLRRSNEFRKVADSLPRQQRQFEKVARQALEDNPQLANRVSREVNDALGDYFNLTPAERHYIRGVFPFYAWYRAIFMVTIRLPSRAPLKASLMNRVGTLGVEETKEMLGQIPSFLEGAVPLPDSVLEAMGLKPESGRIGILTTQGLNPFHTVREEIDAVEAAFGKGESGSVGREIFTQANPILQAAIESTTGRDLLSGAPVDTNQPFPVSVVRNIVENLPPARIAAARNPYKGDPGKPTLYSNSVRRQLLNFVGVPVRQMSPKRAKSLYLDEFFEPIRQNKRDASRDTKKPPALTGF